MIWVHKVAGSIPVWLTKPLYYYSSMVEHATDNRKIMVRAHVVVPNFSTKYSIFKIINKLSTQKGKIMKLFSTALPFLFFFSFFGLESTEVSVNKFKNKCSVLGGTYNEYISPGPKDRSLPRINTKEYTCKLLSGKIVRLADGIL